MRAVLLSEHGPFRILCREVCRDCPYPGKRRRPSDEEDKRTPARIDADGVLSNSDYGFEKQCGSFGIRTKGRTFLSNEEPKTGTAFRIGIPIPRVPPVPHITKSAGGIKRIKGLRFSRNPFIRLNSGTYAGFSPVRYAHLIFSIFWPAPAFIKRRKNRFECRSAPRSRFRETITRFWAKS